MLYQMEHINIEIEIIFKNGNSRVEKYNNKGKIHQELKNIFKLAEEKSSKFEERSEGIMADINPTVSTMTLA